MQIHELNPLREGLLDRVKDIAKAAVGPAAKDRATDASVEMLSPIASDKWIEKMGQQTAINRLGRLQAQGYGQRAAPQASVTLNKVKSNPQMQQYARTLAQQWMQKSASLSATTSTGGTVQKTATGVVHKASPNNPNLAITPAQQPATTSTGGTAQQTATGTVHRANPNNPNLAANKPQPQATGPVSVGGQKLNPRNPQDAKVLAALKAQGKIAEASPGSPGVSASDAQVAQQYLAKFREWAAKTLATRDPNTYQNITLDQIEKDPEIGQRLKQAQEQVVANRDDDTRLQQAVTEYVTTALAGVQQVIAATKAGTAPTVSATSAPAAQGDITQDLAGMGINTNQLRATGRMLQQKSGGNRLINSSGDPTVDEYLRQLGYRLS